MDIQFSTKKTFFFSKKKKTFQQVKFVVPVDQSKGREKLYKYQDLARELKKGVEYEGESDTHYIWRLRDNNKEPGKLYGVNRNPMKNWDRPDHSTAEIRQQENWESLLFLNYKENKKVTERFTMHKEWPKI